MYKVLAVSLFKSKTGKDCCTLTVDLGPYEDPKISGRMNFGRHIEKGWVSGEDMALISDKLVGKDIDCVVRWFNGTCNLIAIHVN